MGPIDSGPGNRELPGSRLRPSYAAKSSTPLRHQEASMAFRFMNRGGWGIGLSLVALSCSGPDAPAPFMPADPSAYTAKVKNLLTGQAVTDAELQAVTADPKAL